MCKRTPSKIKGSSHSKTSMDRFESSKPCGRRALENARALEMDHPHDVQYQVFCERVVCCMLLGCTISPRCAIDALRLHALAHLKTLFSAGSGGDLGGDPRRRPKCLQDRSDRSELQRPKQDKHETPPSKNPSNNRPSGVGEG